MPAVTLIVLLLSALVLRSLMRPGRLRARAAVLWFSGTMAGLGVWLIVSGRVEGFDVAFGFGATSGPLPTLIVASTPQIVGAGLLWAASMLVAGVVGHRLARPPVRTVDD